MPRIAVVTGGSRGIGRAIVERLLADGAAVVTCGRGERPPDLPDPVFWVKADVSKSADCEQLLAEAGRSLGAPAIVVCNAGVQVEKTVPETTDADWEEVVGINCKGVFNMARAAIPRMEEAGGVIIAIGSISGHAADPSMALYNASKAFVHGLVRSIAVDHGPRIRCNAVLPGWIDTGMADAAFALANDPARAEVDALARHAAGRLGRPEDIASAVAWLSSQDAAFVTGQCLVVDGGLTAASPIRPELCV